MSPVSKHPFLKIEELVKVWVADYSVPSENSSKKGGRLLRLPLQIGSLKNVLAFPLYMVRNSEGVDEPANNVVWDRSLIERLFSGGENYYLKLPTPSKTYCIVLLEYHYDELSTTAQYRFIQYLRQLLQSELVPVKKQLRSLSPSSDTYGISKDLWQARYDILQYCLKWVSDTSKEITSDRRNAKKIADQKDKLTGKIQVLAYLILIISGRIPELSSESNRAAQIAFIAGKTGLEADTVDRYLKTKPGKSPQYLIYTRDNKAAALDHISTLIEEVDVRTLKYPVELRGAV